MYLVSFGFVFVVGLCFFEVRVLRGRFRMFCWVVLGFLGRLVGYVAFDLACVYVGGLYI